MSDSQNMTLRYQTFPPTPDEYLALFQTSGWNEDYHLTSHDLAKALKESAFMVSAYDEGISGTTCNAGLYTSLIPLEDAEHQVRFYVFRRDAEGSAIPRDHVIFSDLAFPQAADWTFYSDLDAATDFSRRFYQSCARHFVDGTPRLDAKNPSYLWQNIAFAKGYPARGPAG